MREDEYVTNVERLKLWADAYYTKDEPIASDEEYDKLHRACKKFEEENPELMDPTSPTQHVGGKLLDSFTKMKHPNKMWSQQDIFNKEELIDWFKKVDALRIHDLAIEPKFDGMSLKIIYNFGKLQVAITRGDGLVGEVVTDNALVVDNIPATINYKKYVEINGEVVIGKKDFNSINKQREKEGLDLYANPRNLAAGSMRLLDSNVTAKRRLQFIPWELVNSKDIIADIKPMVHLDGYLLEHLGFKVTDMASHIDFYNGDIINFMWEVEKTIARIHDKREKYDIPLDGCVLKIIDDSFRDELGYTNKFPKWSCAYKFPAVEKTTTVEGIKLQVGRTGVVVPVAMLTPTLIDGSTVERATLHNFEEMESKDIRIGDQVTLIKSGDIIPKIIKVFKDRRDKSVVKYIPPTTCPVCQSKLVKEKVALRCVNDECHSKLAKRLEFFAGREYMNIDGLGESVADDLVKHNLVRSPIDLYSLSYEKLEMLDGYKEKKINNLLTAINSTKGCELYRLYASLGISGMGKTLSKEICNKIDVEILNWTTDLLMDIEGISDTLAENIMKFIGTHAEYIYNILEIVKPINTLYGVVDKYANEVIVLTGTFPNGKKSIEAELKEHGYKTGSSLSKSTSYLIYGDKTGSKLDKAKKLNVPYMTFDEFKEKILNKES